MAKVDRLKDPAHSRGIHTQYVGDPTANAKYPSGAEGALRKQVFVRGKAVFRDTNERALFAKSGVLG